MPMLQNKGSSNRKGYPFMLKMIIDQPTKGPEFMAKQQDKRLA